MVESYHRRNYYLGAPLLQRNQLITKGEIAGLSNVRTKTENDGHRLHTHRLGSREEATTRRRQWIFN